MVELGPASQAGEQEENGQVVETGATSMGGNIVQGN